MDYIFEDVVPEENRIEQHVIENLRSEEDKAVEPSEEESSGDTENHTVDEGNIDNYEEDEDTDEDEDYKEEDEDVDKDSGSERMLSIAYVDATSELEASSVDKSTYHASNLYDGNYTTAWVDGVEGSAAGQSLTIHLNKAYDISRIDIYNGYCKTRYRYTINGQVTLMGIDYGDGRMREHEMNVMYPGMDDVPFSYDELNPTVIVNDGSVHTDTIRLTILADIPGTKYYDTAISEIEIYGR